MRKIVFSIGLVFGLCLLIVQDLSALPNIVPSVQVMQGKSIPVITVDNTWVILIPMTPMSHSMPPTSKTSSSKNLDLTYP